MRQQVRVPRVALVPRKRLAVVRVAAAAVQAERADLANLRALVGHGRTRHARLHQKQQLERLRVPAEHPQRARGVVRVEQVHQHRGVRRARAERVSPAARVAADARDVRGLVRAAHLAVRPPEPVRVHGRDLVVPADGVVLPQLHAAAHEPHRARPEGVVHERVEVPVLADVVRPDAEQLADGDAALFFRAAPVAEPAPERGLDLDRVIQTPAVDVELAHPKRADVQDVLADALVREIELGQVGQVPPALVVHVVPLDAVRHDGKGFGQEPVLVRALLLRVQQRGERPVPAAGVVEDAVQYEAHPASVARRHELAHRVLAAQHRVHLHEVTGVVPMVRGAQEHRRGVQRVHAERLDVVQVRGDAAQRAALEAADGGRRSPRVHLRARREARGVGREAVGEDLVHHRVLPPVERARRVRGRGLDDPPRRSVVVRERTTTREGSGAPEAAARRARRADAAARAGIARRSGETDVRAQRARCREHHDAVCGLPRGVWPTRINSFRAFCRFALSQQQAF